MELLLEDIYEQANEAIEQLWRDGEIPADELERFIQVLINLSGIDTDSTKQVLDGLMMRHTALNSYRREKANRPDNVIDFLTTQN